MWTDILENSPAVSHNINRVLIGSRKFSLRFLLKRLENSCSYNNLLTKAMAAMFITVEESARSWGMDGYELHPYHMSISHEKPTHAYYCLYGKTLC